MFHPAPKSTCFPSWQKSCCWPGAVCEAAGRVRLLWARGITPISTCKAGMSLTTQTSEGAAVLHGSSLLERRFGCDPPLHPFHPPPSSLHVRPKDPSVPSGRASTQGTLVTVPRQLIPSPPHGCISAFLGEWWPISNDAIKAFLSFGKKRTFFSRQI